MAHTLSPPAYAATRPAPIAVPDCGACDDFGTKRSRCTHGPRHSVQPRPGWFHPITWADGVMPLWEFGREHEERIAAAVARRTPPGRWITGELYQMPSRAYSEWHWHRGLRLRPIPGYVPRGRRHIPDDLRMAVYERDGFTCLHCGSVENLSLDHIHPYSRGGEDTFDNLQTLCRSCNSKKGARI